MKNQIIDFDSDEYILVAIGGNTLKPSVHTRKPIPATRVAPEAGDCVLSLEDAERMHVRRIVAYCGGNLSVAARILRVGRTTLYRYARRGWLDNLPDPPCTIDPAVLQTPPN